MIADPLDPGWRAKVEAATAACPIDLDQAASVARPKRRWPRRSSAITFAVLVLTEALDCNRDLYHQARVADDYPTSADRAVTLRQLERERVETENAIQVLREYEAAS